MEKVRKEKAKEKRVQRAKAVAAASQISSLIFSRNQSNPLLTCILDICAGLGGSKRYDDCLCFSE